MGARARMRMQSLALVATLVALFAPMRARADGEGSGTRAASFLQTAAAPRWSAMGGAGLASGGDLSSAVWNAASLASLSEARWEVMHAELPSGGQLSWGSLGGRHPGGTRWALTALHRSEGDIEGRDASNQPTQTFTAQSLALGLTLARPVGSLLSVGGTARYVGEHIGATHGNGLAFGFGAQARLGVLRVAISGQDFGGGMRWEHQQWAMPATLAAGFALVHEGSGLTLATDLASPAAGLRSLRTGAEWTIGGRAALRTGWRQELGVSSADAPGGPSFGLGLAVGAMWLDYSIESGARSEGVQRVGLSLAPGRRGGGLALPGSPGFVGPTLPPGPTRD